MSSEAEDDISGDLWPLAPLDDRPGPARRISPEEARAMVLTAMSSAPENAQFGAGGARRGRALFAFAAVTAMFVTTAAAAAMYLAARSPSPAPTPEPKRKVESAAVFDEHPEELEEEADLDADADADAEAAVEEAEAEAPDAHDAPPRPRAMRPARAAEDLLERASALRGDRRWREAERTYLRVKRNFPKTHAGYVATIAAASLRLEHLDDAKGARTLYRIARKRTPNGALDADVLFGLAGAEHALGDLDGERRALAQLLEQHPKSVFAASARRRLGELESAAP